MYRKLARFFFIIFALYSINLNRNERKIYIRSIKRKILQAKEECTVGASSDAAAGRVGAQARAGQPGDGAAGALHLQGHRPHIPRQGIHVGHR